MSPKSNSTVTINPSRRQIVDAIIVIVRYQSVVLTRNLKLFEAEKILLNCRHEIICSNGEARRWRCNADRVRYFQVIAMVWYRKFVQRSILESVTLRRADELAIRARSPQGLTVFVKPALATYPHVDVLGIATCSRV